MSSIYQGIPDIITAHADLAISASSNTTPIRITTTLAHDLTSGDRVIVRNHTTNIKANGLWAVVVIDANNVDLYVTYGGTASAPTAAGGATGTIKGLGVLPSATIPSDADDITAASVNVKFEDAGDKEQWLAVRTPFRYLAQEFDVGHNDDTIAAWLTQTVSNAGYNFNASSQFGQIVDVYNGDLVEVIWTTTIDTTAAVDTGAFVKVYSVLSDYGVAPVYAAAVAATGGGLFVEFNRKIPITLVARIPIVIATAKLQQLSIMLNMLGFTAFNRTVTLKGDYLITVRVLRPR